jgi:hypothetical protein
MTTFFKDALLSVMTAHEGGFDSCSNSSGFSRKLKKRQAPTTTSPCDPGT